MPDLRLGGTDARSGGESDFGPGVPDFGHLAGGEEEHSDFVVGREITRHQHLCMHACTGFFFMAAAGVMVL